VADDIDATLTLLWSDKLAGDARPSATIRDPRLGSGPGVTIDLSTSTLSFPAERPCQPDGDEGDAGATLDLGTPSAIEGSTAGTTPDFEILRQLGKGGMGIVYAARQHSLTREVALKVPRIEPESGAEMARRFVVEAQVTGRLDHPNIVPVYTLGRDDDGNLFMAMKLVRGTPWDQLLAARDDPKGDLRDHLDILIKVADAVAFAHARGILHRDLKPENVMVGEFGEVLLMDWGVALDLTAAARADDDRVRNSAGTPSYMAPELVLADFDRIGPRTDVYLLGAILYEILTGTPPHRGARVWEVLRAAARGVIEPPEERAPGREIPRELSRIAVEALAPDPADRHPDVAGFRQALRDYLSHAESLRLAEEGQALLDELAQPRAIPLAERYAGYARALGSFSQALHLWPQNDAALIGQAHAAAEQADEALDRGDVGLATAQLALLEQNPRAEAERRDAIRASIRIRTAAGWRARLGAVVVLAALVAGLLVMRGWQAQADERTSERERDDAVNRTLSDAWGAVRQDDLRDLRRSRFELEELAQPTWKEPEPELDDLRGWLVWAQQVMLWQRGRWQELAPEPAEPVTNRRRPKGQAESVVPPPCDRFLAVAEGTVLAQPLRRMCSDGGENDVGLWPHVIRAVRFGLEPAVLAALDDEWRRYRAELSPPPTAAERRLRWRAELHRSAAAHVAADMARRRGELELAARWQDEVRPFVLSRTPFGSPVAPLASRDRLRLVQQRDSSWIAFDETTGERRWRSLPLAEQYYKGVVVPVADGTMIVASGAQLVRLDGASGDVLERRYLDGRALLAWPELDDPTRLSVLVALDENDWFLERVSVADDTVAGPSFQGQSTIAQLATRTAATTLRDQLRKEAAARLGIEGRAASDDPRVRAAVARDLTTAAERDPTNPHLLLAALEELAAETPAATRTELVGRILAITDLPPFNVANLGAELDKLGSTEAADAMYDRAAAGFLDDFGNADINLMIPTSPTVFVRGAGGELFRRGATERALELIETGRRFSSYAEGDHKLYQRYVLWLRQNGRDEEADQIAPRIEESRTVGGFLMLGESFLVSIDAAVVILVLSPWMLLALLLRTWWRTRATRNADLHARGWRTAGQRLAAFVTHPVDRLGCLFLSYASRGERLLIAGLGGVILASASILAGGLATVGEAASQPVAIANGYAGNAVMLQRLEHRIASSGPDLPTLRLLAESRRRRPRTQQPGRSGGGERSTRRGAPPLRGSSGGRWRGRRGRALEPDPARRRARRTRVGRSGPRPPRPVASSSPRPGATAVGALLGRRPADDGDRASLGDARGARLVHRDHQ